MGNKRELLKFLIDKKIPIREAIDFLTLAERMIVAKRLSKQKAIAPDYEKRGG
jgi:hypothetical protein